MIDVFFVKFFTRKDQLGIHKKVILETAAMIVIHIKKLDLLFQNSIFYVESERYIEKDREKYIEIEICKYKVKELNSLM